MTNNELLKIESYLLDRKKPDYELAKKIMEACERLTPKKVTHEASLYKCCTCPKCKNVVDAFTDFNGQKVKVTYAHCRFCGQALDWSDAE